MSTCHFNFSISQFLGEIQNVKFAGAIRIDARILMPNSLR